MKTTRTSAKRAALIAVLVVGSSAWLSAQTNQGRSGQPGTALDRPHGTNIQYNQRPSGQPGTALDRPHGTNSQYNQGRSGQPAGGQNRQDTYRANTNSQYNQGRSGQPGSGLGRGTNAQASQWGTNAQASHWGNAQASQPLKINKGSSLIGTTVKNQQGETLGKVSDVVIDFRTERVSYVVLDSASGVLSAQKLHAVPLRAFQPDPAGTSLILNAEKAKLDRAEGFVTDKWPSVAAPTWGAEPFWKNAQGTQDSPEQRALDQRYNQEDRNKDSQLNQRYNQEDQNKDSQLNRRYNQDGLNKDSQNTPKQPKAQPQSRP